jgi:hypothetical protein
MNTNKLAYFIALGVLALGLTSEYQKGSFPAIHRALGVTENSLCRLATRAQRAVAAAQLLTGREPEKVRLDDDFIVRQSAQVEQVMAEHQADIDRALAHHRADLDRVMTLRQAHLDCLQQKLDRMHVVLDRAQLQRVRVLERTRVQLSDAANRRMILVCPKTGAKITVHTDAYLPDLDTNLPAIEVKDSF